VGNTKLFENAISKDLLLKIFPMQYVENYITDASNGAGFAKIARLIVGEQTNRFFFIVCILLRELHLTRF
jgi:hypothetical protein